jgi:signal transduction histidine kinase
MRKSTRSPELRHTITDVREKLIGVVTSVQKMSHELHSSKLEYFGLVPAIRSFCNEFSEGEKVAIHFNSEAYPVLCQLSFHFPCSESCKKLYGMPSSIAK